MRKKVFIFVSCIVVKILLHSSEWTTISPGVEYRKFTLSDPNDVYVVRIKRNTPNLVLDVGVGGATIRDIREPVSKIVARYQNIVNYDGECYTILAAINGDFFSYTTDQVIGGQVIAGSYVDKMGPRGKYVYCKDNSMWIEKIVSFSAVVTFVDGSTETINNINVPRGTNELILYTHHYDYSTFTTGEGCEVVVNEVVEPLRPNKEIVGRIKEVRTEGQTPALIPFDGFVLSASGIKKDMLKLKSKVGDIIKVKIIVESNLGYDWSKAYSAIEGAQWFVSNGQLTSDLWEERHPRTAVAYNNDYIYLIVCDGRRSTSLGMKLSELGNFCIQYLQATEALNLDGGGSSTMWVNGEVKNKPSDGTERAVANALFVAKLTVDKNTRFKNNDQIKIISPTYLKLGAGTQFGSITFLDKNTICVISSSPLNGVYAKNYYWWKVKYNNQEGWITQDVMCDTIPPPVPQLISPANGIQMYDRNPTFSWSSVKDPDGVYYTLIVSSTPDFSSNIIYIVNLTTSQYIPDQHGDFKVDTTYYWKVKAADRGENESDFSEIYSFVIISSDDITSPGRVDNLYAKSGWLTGSVLLSWTSPGDDDYNGNIQNGMYRIDYATYNKTNWDHRNYKIKITTFVNVYTTQHLLITGLIPNLTYYFCLWTSDEFLQWSQPSNIASTYAKPLPAKPELLLPKDNTLFITTNSVVLMWNTSPEIVNSYIEISTVSNFKTLFTSIVVSDINTYIIHNLDNNTYYWRVCGETEYKEKSLWTSYGKFYVKTSTDIISSDINLLYEQLTPQQINFLFSNVLDVYFNLSVESKILPILISSISFVYKIEEQSIHKNEWHILYPSIDEKTGSYYVQIYNYRGHNLDSINYFNVVYLTNGWILQTPLYKITYVKNKEQLIGLNGGKIILYDTNPYDREAYVEIKQNVLEVDGVVNIQQYAENLPPLTLPGIVSLDPPIAIKISGLSGKNKECGIFCIKYNDIYNPQKIKALYYDGIQWHTTYCWIDTSSMEIKGKLLGDGIYALFVIAEEVNYDNYKPTQNIVFFNKFQRCQVFFPVMTVNPEIEIKIYDIKGRLVKKISKIEYWDGKDEKGQEVPTGTYIYKYIIGGKQYTGTVILLK